MARLAELAGLALPFLLLALALWLFVWGTSKLVRNFRAILARLRRFGPADALTTAVALLCFQLAWSNVAPDSFLGSMVALYHTGEAAKTPVLKERAAIDQAFSAYAQRGNVFVKFIGFHPERKIDHDFLELYYYRAAYATYPSRLYCANPTNSITSADDLARFAFVPTEQWLDAHRVGTIATFRLADKGQVAAEATERVVKVISNQ